MPSFSVPSRTACIAAHRLGLTLDQLERPDTNEPSIDVPLTSGTRVLITGPSGSGKTRLLRSIEKHCISRGIRAVRPFADLPMSRAALDVIAPRLSIDSAMRALARAGLADASTMIRRVGELSAGQLERLRLAKAMHEIGECVESIMRPGAPRAVLILDEFGATLDDETLAGVARLVRAFIDHTSGVAAVIATHRAGVVTPHLAPTTSITLDDAGAASIAHHLIAAESTQRRYAFSTGTRDDLAALAHHHYRTRPPATIDRVFRATGRDSGSLAAVLTLSLPTLNAAWRRLAWPGRYDTPDKRANAQRLNDEIRCISRVIVAPPHRGLGLARALVAHALRSAPTPRIEALAALGHAGAVFRAAGMTEFPVPISPHDARLRDLIDEAGIDAWRLATPREAMHRLCCVFPPPLIESELRRWSDASRATRGTKRDPADHIFTKACERLARDTRAYAWQSPASPL